MTPVRNSKHRLKRHRKSNAFNMEHTKYAPDSNIIWTVFHSVIDDRGERNSTLEAACLSQSACMLHKCQMYDENEKYYNNYKFVIIK